MSSIGVRVSPAPRMAAPRMIELPKPNCTKPQMRTRAGESSSSPGWSVTRRTHQPGTATKARPRSVIAPAPPSQQATAARLAPAALAGAQVLPSER